MKKKKVNSRLNLDWIESTKSSEVWAQFDGCELELGSNCSQIDQISVHHL